MYNYVYIYAYYDGKNMLNTRFPPLPFTELDQASPEKVETGYV